MVFRNRTSPRPADDDAAAREVDNVQALPRNDERIVTVAAEPGAGRLLMLFTLGAVTLLLAAGGIVIYLAYDRQSYVVERLQEENQQIQSDHSAIGQKFAQQSKQVVAAIRRAESAYVRGFTDGTRGRRLPRRFAPLRPFRARGLLTPRAIPPALRSKRVRIRPYRGGYTLGWRGRPTVFASARVSLRTWTRRAWPGGRARVFVGGRRVLRLVGPTGIVYAWRERRGTYAVLSFPSSDAAARGLIAAMR